ncbi:MAG: tetratricopeptide repeat protein [Bryobacterales bacterium]|nr:tetratricopeptide repeat protein [Bryobacterales bacterium]
MEGTFRFSANHGRCQSDWPARRANVFALPGRSGLALLALVLSCLAVADRGRSQALDAEAIEVRVTSHLAAARQAESVQDYLAAAEEYRSILALRPEWALIHQSLGVTYHLAKRYLEAIEALQRAVRLDDQLWGAYLFLGMDYYQTHRFDLAVSALERSMALRPGMVETHRWLGLSHAALLGYENAIGHLRQVLEADAGDTEALFHLARAYDMRASQLFRSIGEREPDSPFVYLLQAERLASEGDIDRARAEGRRALGLRPDLADILESLDLGSGGQAPDAPREAGAFAGIRTSFSAGRFLEASDKTRLVLEAQPGHAEAMYWLGRSYKGLAAATLDRLTQSAPDSYRVDQLAGEFHEDRTEYGKAAEAYRRALEKQPEVPGLRYAIGSVHWKAGSFKEAQKWLEHELLLSPDHALARHRLGNLLLASDQPGEALPHLVRALETNPDLAEAHLDLGRAYFALDQFSDAVEAFEAYARIDPDSDRVHVLLGNAYRGLGRLEDARREFQTYQRLSRERLRQVQQDVRSVSADLEKAAGR